MTEKELSIQLGKHAHNKEYKEAIELIRESDDVVRILAYAYDNEGYDIIGETTKVNDLLLSYAKSNFNASFLAEIACAISENKTNIETYLMGGNSEAIFDYSITSGDNPCIGIYEKLVESLYIIAIQKSNGEDDNEVISEYLEYEGYTLEEFKEK